MVVVTFSSPCLTQCWFIVFTERIMRRCTLDAGKSSLLPPSVYLLLETLQLMVLIVLTRI